jgi:hypothetical protein
MKQAHYLFTPPEETLRFSEDVFQEDAIIDPSP